MTATHYATSPGVICDAIISALSIFLKTPSAGCVKTLARYPGDSYDAAAIDQLMVAGTPGYLVAYLGGTFQADSTDGRRHLEKMKFSVICAANSYYNRELRLAGATATVDTAPGVEDLLDWATYHGYRAMENLKDASLRKLLTRTRPLNQKWLRIEPTKYLAVIEFETTRMFDFYDEIPTTTLTKVGLVHDPVSYSQLFIQPGNTVSNSNDPPTIAGGVTTL